MITAFDSYDKDRCRRQFQLMKQVFRAKYHRKFRNDIGILKGFLPPDGVYFDIGANHGRVSLELSRLHGGRCRVFAFEPLPYNQRVIEKVLGGRGNVKVIHDALSDCEEVLTAYVPVRAGDGVLEHGSTFLAPASERERLEKAERLYLGQDVRTILLDGFVQEQAVARLDFIKLDVEGHEARVLAGGRDALGRFRPTIMMEVSIKSQGDAEADPGAALRLLGEMGYQFYDLDLGEVESWGDDVDLIVERIKGSKGHHDVLCWHAGGPIKGKPAGFACSFAKTRYGD